MLWWRLMVWVDAGVFNMVQVYQRWKPPKIIVKSWREVTGWISCGYTNMLRELWTCYGQKSWFLPFFLSFKSPVQDYQWWKPPKIIIKSWLLVTGSISCGYTIMLRERLDTLRSKKLIFAIFLPFKRPVQVNQPWGPKKSLIKSWL